MPECQGQSDGAVRLIARGFLNNVLVESLALTHMKKLFGPTLQEIGTHMIEIEFLDEADREQRFFRVGTDPRRMVKPYEVDLTNPEAALQKLLEQYR